MRTHLLFLVLLLPAIVYAQEETLLSGEVHHGGFGGPVVKMTRINGEDALLVGGRGGWIINHTFVIGAGGYGLVSEVRPKTPGFLNEDLLMLGYGGLELEFIAASDKIVHMSFPLLIGAGALGYRYGHFGENMNLGFSFDRKFDTFFVIEPGANVELNVVSFFRITAGASYRYVTGVGSVTDPVGTQRSLSSNTDLRGFSWNLGFKFGSF